MRQMTGERLTILPSGTLAWVLPNGKVYPFVGGGALGVRDTRQLVTLTGWDLEELKKHELQDGTTFDVVVSQMNAALAALNGEIYGDPLYSSLVSYTDQPEMEYRVGVSNGFERFTEYGRPDAQRADTAGHMLPLLSFDRALGWTWDYLRKARLTQIQADIADAIKDARAKYRVQILTRMLQRGDDSGVANGLGATGYSPGFCTAAANTEVDFRPPDFEGTVFDSNHEHYVSISGGKFTAAVFSDAYDELIEHGHEPPFDFVIGLSDKAEVEGLTGFVKVKDPLVDLGDDTASARLNAGEYIGTISSFRVKVVRAMPRYWGFGYKSYGPNSQRNPLRIRLQKGQTRPQIRAFPDPRSGAGAAYPLQYMMLFTEFGVGVADRTAATPRYVNSATWADGTPLG
jgi:hypothetical protein